MQKGQALILILVGVLIIAVIAGGAYYLGRSNISKPLTPDANREPTGSAETVYTEATRSANWKTYTNDKFSFKYPPDLTVEEREKDFFVIVPVGILPAPQQGISIDARLNGDLLDFFQAVESSKKNLVDVKVETINNGVKIFGKVGSGFGEGIEIVTALLRYGPGAISIEKLKSDNSIPQEIFDELVASFGFLYKNVSWEEAVGILNSGQVKAIEQLHNLEVSFILDDGSYVKTKEPKINAISAELSKCQVCKNKTMTFSTE